MPHKSKIPQYIIAISPNKEIVERVDELKQQLYDLLGGSFPSYKSLAHVTIEEFDADEEKLQRRWEIWKSFAASQNFQPLTFNSFASFSDNQTIFAVPDESSNLWITRFAAVYYQAFGRRKRITPHMTIGRRIDSPLFKQAEEVFLKQEVNLSFVCNDFALRKFNNGLGQYDIIERYYFGNTQGQ